MSEIRYVIISAFITQRKISGRLKGKQTKLPHHLRLPVNPTKELLKYYCTQSFVTLWKD